MSIRHLLLAGIVVLVVSCGGRTESEERTGAMADQSTQQAADIMDIPFKTITGETTSLRAYEGHPILIVNVASKCGYTPQYEGLQKIYEEYKDAGLVVMGFPANNFGGQEPGSNKEILEFCTSEYHVTFPMMAKISVRGEDKHPLFKRLTEGSPISGEINWNFTKFLLNKKGQLVARFDTKVEPTSKEVRDAIAKVL
ncbi:MAG: glutathione peroxidase [Candidatus Zixiibacteriota bacterium]